MVAFARLGYRDATISEICEAAGANIAAVNYHFRSKENLYVEAWRHAFRRSTTRYPPDGGVPADAPAAKRLRGHVRSMLQRISDPQCHEFEIIHKEMANPTGLLSETMRECIEPLQAAFRQIVRELLGPDADEQTVQLCLMSVRAQCFGPMLHERRRRAGPADGLPVPPPIEVDTDRFADHVIRFSLAGIKAVRRRLQDARRRRDKESA